MPLDAALHLAEQNRSRYGRRMYLMRALGLPRTVIATHWDMQSAPYGASQDPQLEQAQTFVREVNAVSPDTKVIVPRHFETVAV